MKTSKLKNFEQNNKLQKLTKKETTKVTGGNAIVVLDDLPNIVIVYEDLQA